MIYHRVHDLWVVAKFKIKLFSVKFTAYHLQKNIYILFEDKYFALKQTICNSNKLQKKERNQTTIT